MDPHLTSAVPVVVVDLRLWPVDWELFKVGASMAVELSVEVTEQTALK